MQPETTNPIRMFDRLIMLRDEVALHNPKSDRVETLSWAIHVLEKAQQVGDQAAYLSGCLQ